MAPFYRHELSKKKKKKKKNLKSLCKHEFLDVLSLGYGPFHSGRRKIKNKA
jgi:hypothetical protein